MLQSVCIPAEQNNPSTNTNGNQYKNTLNLYNKH